jgi:NAD(P)-dependent dehydrogenase (short-subunit alcohol dehydrogenase family)
MNATIAVTKEVTTLINILTVEPENQPKLIELLRDNTENVVSTLDGWISTSFIVAKDSRQVVIYSQWRELASLEAMRANPKMRAYFPRIAALARDRAKLAAAEQFGAAVIAGDATDATLMNHIVGDEGPDVLILNAGAGLPMKPIDEQSWEEFSAPWNTDVRAALVGIQAALKIPLKPGGRILIMSSGASMVLGVPYIRPDSLRLSGGYIGAKRMLWFMAHSANAVSRERGLGLHFQVLVPLSADAGYGARSSGSGRVRRDRGGKRGGACRAALWLDFAPGGGRRACRRVARRFSLRKWRRLRFSRQCRYHATRHVICTKPSS